MFAFVSDGKQKYLKKNMKAFRTVTRLIISYKALQDTRKA